MKRRNSLILIVILALIPVGWYLLSPLFINREVSEALPVIPSPTTVVDGPEAAAEATKQMEEALTQTPTEMAEPMPEAASMQILAQGLFYHLAHEGAGTAAIYLLADGSRILRLEGFTVLNGPDLHVYLTTQDPVLNTVGVELDGAVDLGELKGNIGDQNYELPAGLDISLIKSVVIWCQPFRVPFIAAPLRVP